MDGKDAIVKGNSFLKSHEDQHTEKPQDPSDTALVPRVEDYDGPFVMRLLRVPKVEPLNLNPCIVFTGSASRGVTGPAIGAVDIGVSKNAYFFQVALPGVKKDPGHFSCEVELDGKVHIRGITSTGGRTVERHSRVYEMKFQQQCPPGPFTLSFNLPGPVDPRLFSPNFRSDGILEAVVTKYE